MYFVGPPNKAPKARAFSTFGEGTISYRPLRDLSKPSERRFATNNGDVLATCGITEHC